MTDIITTTITLPVADATPMQAYVAQPKMTEQVQGGLIVLQDAFGVNAFIRKVAERFVQEGYVAIVPELYHRTAPGFEAPYTDFESCKPHMTAMTDAGLEADLQAAYEWLHSEQKIAPDKIHSVGFCMGGRASFIANSVLPLASAIAFYGGGISQLLDRTSSLHGPMLFLWGGLDKQISIAERRSVADALEEHHKKFVDITFSDANHAFFCSLRTNYHPKASAIAWSLVLQFLSDHS